MARHLPNQRTKFISRLDRLDQHLVKNSDFDNKVKESLPGLWLPYLQDDTPIILDLSDLAKPLAMKLDYLATVRDGSTGELVNGYWLLEMYASLSRKNPVPVLLEPFSHEEPYSPGQNPVVLNAVHKIFKLADNRRVSRFPFVPFVRRSDQSNINVSGFTRIYCGKAYEKNPKFE